MIKKYSNKFLVFSISIFILVFFVKYSSAQWNPIGPYNGTCYCITSLGNNLFAGSDNGVLISSDNGLSWRLIGLPNKTIISIVSLGENLFVGLNSEGIYKSTNNGLNWFCVNNGIPAGKINALAVYNQTIFAGTYYNGIYKSNDYGSSWIQCNTGLHSTIVYSLLVKDTNIFAGALGYYNDIVYLSTNMGASWISRSSGIPEEHPLTLSYCQPYLFVGTYNGVSKSSNLGLNWTMAGLNYGSSNPNQVLCLTTDGSTLFAGTGGGYACIGTGVYKTTNYGNNWIQIGLNDSTNTYTLLNFGNKIFAGQANGIYFSSNNGVNWILNGCTKLNISSIAIIDSTIFAGTSYYSIFSKSISGNTWCRAGLQNQETRCLLAKGNFIYAGTEIGLSKTSNHGINWLSTGLPNYPVNKIISNSEMGLIAGTEGHGIYISTNNGINWSVSNSGLTHKNIKAITNTSSNIFIGTDSGFFYSSNNGVNWVERNSGLSNLFIKTLIVFSSNIYVGTYGNGIFVSSNYGQNWIPINIGLTNLFVNSLISSGSNIFAGTKNGVFMYSFSQMKWLNKTQGFMYSPEVNSFLIMNNYIYVATDSQAVWSRSISDIIGIRKAFEYSPSIFGLSQNYPNPFNPSTKIRYDIPKYGFVKLTVFDILGKEIEKLVYEKQTPGIYEATFNGSFYPSGVYFYKLTIVDPTGKTDGFTDTKRMILIK